MFTKLLNHEILNLLKSRRVYLTVIMFLLLFTTVFVVRVLDYQKQVNQYIEDVKVNDEAMANIENYSHITPRAIQEPILFSIYNEGYRIQRVINIKFYEAIIETTSINAERNMLFFPDTELDITFLITFFLSLFILLISYDSVNGEKQVGTLRLLMTYPLKRQSFILKKMLGVFIFVAFVFTMPYFLSIISLMVIYANLLTINFFISAFFYWFLTIFFILFFSLLGIFLSTCSKSPNQSLVYAILTWMVLCIIIPISWDYIISPSLSNERIHQATQNYHTYTTQAKRAIEHDLPDDANLRLVPMGIWTSSAGIENDGIHEMSLWGYDETYEQSSRFQSHLYENYYPLIRASEQAYDDVYRVRINTENMMNRVFFFNPIVIFHNLSMKIAGNSRVDHLVFLHTARELRDDLVNLGATEGWLFDYRFYAHFKEEYNLGSREEMLARFDGDRELVWEYVNDIEENAEMYEMEVPVFRKYEQPHFTLAMMIPRIFESMVLFVGSIVGLWVVIWWRFLGYDVR
ncbi:MAG: ABC transporter permease subunit [Candidatus Cloacimonetes bacterium]|nr:ABC transporter permease subunit [Candidatus Cloacimonadota bacterium]